MAVVFDAEMERPEEFDAEFGGTFQRVTIPGKDGGYYTPVIEQVDAEHMRVTYVPSQEGMEPIAPLTIKLPQGPKGDAYILTDTDKKEIAEEAAELIEVGEFVETDPTVPDWAKQPQKPPYSAEEVGAEPSGTAEAKVSEHNTASDAHNDIRVLIEALTTRLKAFFDSDDTTLDELSEIVEYIKSNKSLIDSITTSKVSVSDIINNLTTNVTNKPLSAAQGVVLKSLIDALSTAKLDANALADWAKQANKPSYTASEVGALPSTTKIPSTPAEVGADPAGTAGNAVSAHNTNTEAHNDMRLQLQALTDRLNAFFDSDDTTLDELSEIVTYIKSNKTLIDSITTSKVNVSDIIDNLITNVANKPLSAAQGVVLKGLIDALNTAKLDTSKLQEAIDSALAQAKASGEFDGEDGVRGKSMLRITTAPTAYTTETGGFTPAYRIALSTVLSQSGATEVMVGDTILRNYYTYPVGYVDASYVYIGKYSSIRGSAGTSVTITETAESTESGGSNVVTFSDGKTLNVKNGKDGEKGDSGVYYGSPENAPSTAQVVVDPNGGTDEIAELQETVQQLSEEIDDQQEQVNSLTLGIASDGLIYLFKGGSPVGTGIPQGQSGDVFGYVDENNTIVLTGNLADGTYAIKYEMEDGSTLDIGELELGEEDDGNLLPKAINADGSPYVGDNGEKGYNTGYRIKSSGEQVAQANTCCIGFIPVTFNDKIYVKNIAMSGTASYNSIAFYDSSKTKLYNTAFASSGYAWVTYTDGVFCFTINQMSSSAQNAAFFRLSCGGITDDTIITVNKPIA